MRHITFLTWLFTACLWIQAAHADIYVWTDENGIRHFSNRNPHPEAKLFLKSMEGPYEEAVERAQKETEKQREWEQAEAEIQERKERLAKKVEELEQRAEEAKREAREALERAEKLEEAVDRRYQDDRWHSTGYAYYPGYYRYRPYVYRGYRFSVTHHSGYRYRPGASHKQIDGDRHRNRDRHFTGNRNARHRGHAAGQARFPGNRRGGWRR